MIKHLILLKKSAPEFCTKQISHANITDFCKVCKKLEVSCLTQVFKLGNLQNATTIYSNLFIELVVISDVLYGIDNAVIVPALSAVENTIDYLHANYSHLINLNCKVSLSTRNALEEALKRNLVDLNSKLLDKGIDAALLIQLFKAQTDLFKINHAIDRNHQMFLTAFWHQLNTFAIDTRTKDWNKRMRLLLVKCNYNAMGVYKFLMQEQSNHIAALPTNKRLNYIYKKLHELEQIQVVPARAFSLNATGLKELLSNHLLHLQELACLENNDLKNTTNKLHYNLSVDELALQFHYQYQQKYFAYTSKKEAAQAFCLNNRSKQIPNISLHSMLKFDKLEQYNAALKLYKHCKELQNSLVKDFSLKLF